MNLPDGGTPPVVTITFPATCPAFTPCGNSLPGTYFYSSACIDDAEFAPLITLADSLCLPAGSTTISNKSGTVQGGVSFSTTQVTRFISGSINFTATFVGTVCNMATTCMQIPTYLAAYGLTGSCTFNATPAQCVCQMARSLVATGVETYTTSGNQVTTMGAKTRVYDYCVTNGTNLTYREVTPSSGQTIRDPGYFSLTK